MSCPNADALNRWVDGTLDPRECGPLEDHVFDCDACRTLSDGLRRAVDALDTLVEPGPACLDAEAMAAVLDGDAVPPHVKACPRCAAELQALRPAERANATRRLVRVRTPWMSWAAAAAVLFAAGLLALVLRKPDTTEEYVRVPSVRRIPPPPPLPPREEIDPATLPTAPPVEPPAPVEPAPKPVPPEPEKPAPAPAVKPETPSAPVTPPAEPSRVTVTEAPKAVLALLLRSGNLLALANGKWARPQRYEEGMTLRAEGRTQMDFAQARLTLEGNSRFMLSQDELALVEGGLSAEASQGSKFALRLGDERLQPETAAARVLLCARPDRVLIEEGSARWRDRLLPEGVEHQLRKGRFEPQRRRSLPAAARPREISSWRMDLSSMASARKHVIQGRVESMPEGRMLASAPLPGNEFFFGQAQYYNGGEDKPLFVVKAGSALRFRYFLTEDVPLELVLWNQTKGENFNKQLVGIPRQWTTITLPLKDILPNRGGKPAPCELGDKYVSVGLFVGKPGQPADVYLDQIEVVEIDK